MILQFNPLSTNVFSSSNIILKIQNQNASQESRSYVANPRSWVPTQRWETGAAKRTVGRGGEEQENPDPTQTKFLEFFVCGYNQ